MESVNNSSLLNPESQNIIPKKNSTTFSGRKLIIGIVLILFAITLTFLFLFILNFGKNQITKKTSKNIPIQVGSSPTPFMRFSYDVAKAQTALDEYVKNNIKEEFLPQKIDIQQNLIASGRKDGTDYEFGANWEKGDNVFNANFHYIPQTNNFRNMQILISFPNGKNITLDSDNLESMVRTYLKNIPDIINFECGAFQKTTRFCEHFTAEEAGKSGFGTVEAKDESEKNILLIFSCFYPKNDTYYAKRTSCLLFREKDPNGL